MFFKDALNEFRLVAIALIVMGASSCSSSSNPDAPYEAKGTAPEGKHEVISGPLYQAYRSVDESRNREECDTKLSKIKNELITELDLRSNELLRQSLKQNNHPENFVPFSKSYLINNPKKAARIGWQDEPYSWGIIYDFYLKNVKKNKPGFWQTMDAYVRSLITDDRKRVVYGYNFSLTHEQVEKLPELKEVIETCKTDTRCLDPDWSEDQRQIIDSNPSYSYFQIQIERSRFNRDKRRTIEKFFERIDSDFNFHKEDFNSMVSHRTVDGKHIFTLPLDGSIFSDDDRSLLERIITSVWTNDNNAVTFHWAKPTASLRPFRFLFEMEPNNRSNVNFALREIHLFPFTSVRTVAHEFGHVLGFDDHYYTLWDPKKCEYRSQYNEEDIMSGSDTGDVTSGEWDFLLKQYQYR